LIVYLLQLVVWTAIMAAVILWPAGTLWPSRPLGPSRAIRTRRLSEHLVAFQAQSEPAARVMASPVQRAQKPWDRVWLVLVILAFFG
jgi:hypothetical protein